VLKRIPGSDLPGIPFLDCPQVSFFRTSRKRPVDNPDRNSGILIRDTVHLRTTNASEQVLFQGWNMWKVHFSDFTGGIHTDFTGGFYRWNTG